MHDPLSLPILVRPNSVIPVGSHMERPDYDFADGVTLQVYQLEEGKQVTAEIPNPDGNIETRFNIRRDGKVIQIQRMGSSKPWNLLLVGIDSIKDVENANSDFVNGSVLVKAHEGVDEITIRVN